MIAALYVQEDGAYSGIEGVDMWPESRDARKYAGPHPAIAHPPCNRWCQIAPINVARGRFSLGDDGGCFAHALESVRQFGGVLEHPAFSYAWAAYGLFRPRRGAGWMRTFHDRGWVCHVEQGHYGCLAPKPTWLYAVGCELPSMPWGRSDATYRISDLHSAADRQKVPRLRDAAASATPDRFRDVLLQMARSAGG